MILFLVFVGCTVSEKDEFDLDKTIKTRPSRKEYVLDYAHLLKYTKENMEEHLRHFHQSYGIEMFIVTIPSLEGRNITEVALQILTNWNVGRNNNGKGILLLLSNEEKLIKIEVGYGAEHIFTDLFCGYIERMQLGPYFENNQIDEGLSATREEFIGRAEGRLTDWEIEGKMQGYLSGGAGITKEVKIGELTQIEYLSKEEREYFSAQPSPEMLYERFLEQLRRCVSDPTLTMRTEESGIIVRYCPKSSEALCKKSYQRWARPHIIKEKTDYAVVLFPGSRNAGPLFMKKTSEGWQMDILSTKKWIRYDQNNQWFIGGSTHPYIFAFLDNEYSQYLWDLCYYDDFGRFSSVEGDYDYHINVHEKRLNEDPGDFENIISLAEIFVDLTIPKRSVPLLKKAIELDPKDRRAYKYLGLINRDIFCSNKTAIDYFKKYVKLAPNDAWGYHYIAVAYMRMDEFDTAVVYMKKYSRISGDRIYGYNTIGFLYHWKGDYSQAKKWFKKVLEIDPTNEYAKKMVSRLK